MTHSLLSKRHFLSTTAAMAAGSAAMPAFAAAPMMGPSLTPYRRVKLGGFEVTTLLAGTRAVPDPHSIFGLNVDDATFEATSAAARIPTDVSQFFFTPTVVNTGSELILFDTGLSPEGTTAALEAAGYSADQVDRVVITHMHGDHIGGLSDDKGVTFANASYVTGETEFNAWAEAGNEGFDAKMRPLAEQTEMIAPDTEIAPGITAMSAFGHTPGHMVYHLESEGKRLLLAADFANHYVWSLANPDWEVKFDMDKAAAAETRKRLLDMLATDQIPFVGYHMPWPGIGYVVRTSEGGYRYEASSYQLML